MGATKPAVVLLASLCAWSAGAGVSASAQAVPEPEDDAVPELELAVAGAPPAADPAAGEDDAALERAPAYAFAVGLDLYSRFLWRGVSFGEQWTLQPNASFRAYGLSVELWASASPDQSSLVDYVGITLGYAYDAGFGTFGIRLADWIFSQRYAEDGTLETAAPYLFDFANDGEGSHWLDLTVFFTGPAKVPITLQLGAVVYNDPDHSLYAGVLYTIDVGRGFTLTPEFGVVFGRSRRWYGTDADPVNVTNCALTVARTVELGRGVTLPLTVALVVNPEAERVHVVVGVGLRL